MKKYLFLLFFAAQCLICSAQDCILTTSSYYNWGFITVIVRCEGLEYHVTGEKTGHEKHFKNESDISDYFVNHGCEVVSVIPNPINSLLTGYIFKMKNTSLTEAEKKLKLFLTKKSKKKIKKIRQD